jgi:type IV pilus assembly protein PilW
MNRVDRGFSLVEILVALAMGLLAVLVVMQVFALSERSKRTTTGGADASTNGAVVLYLMERDARTAGWGLDESLYLGRAAAGVAAPALPGCSTINTYCSGAASCGGGAAGPIAKFSFASVAIKDGVDGAPDTMTMRYFSNPNVAAYVPPTSAVVIAEGRDGSSVPTLTVRSNFGCNKGDLILISDPTQPATAACTLMQVSATPPVPATGATSTTIPHQSGVATYGVYNNPDWDAGIVGTPLTLTSSMLATCFPRASDGPTFQRVYSIDTATRTLRKTDNTVLPVVTDEVVASDIVDMQAQYGIAPDGSQTVGAWADASAAAGWASPAPAAATVGKTTHGRLQNIKAVRIAVLARSSQYEKPTGASCDATTGSPGIPGGPSSWSTWATFDTSKYPAGWACYRYKAFEIVIPLRNVIWANI